MIKGFKKVSPEIKRIRKLSLSKSTFSMKLNFLK